MGTIVLVLAWIAYVAMKVYAAQGVSGKLKVFNFGITLPIVVGLLGWLGWWLNPVVFGKVLAVGLVALLIFGYFAYAVSRGYTWRVAVLMGIFFTPVGAFLIVWATPKSHR